MLKPSKDDPNYKSESERHSRDNSSWGGDVQRYTPTKDKAGPDGRPAGESEKR